MDAATGLVDSGIETEPVGLVVDGGLEPEPAGVGVNGETMLSNLYDQAISAVQRHR